MARGNQREQAREKAQAKQAAKVKSLGRVRMNFEFISNFAARLVW
jgi:4F5 protein related disordered region